MTTLARKTFQAVLWNFTGSFGNQVIQFLASIVLARLLQPEEFGLVAVLMVFSMLAQALIDSGLGAALIRSRQITRVDESTVFYCNLLIAICLYGIFWFLAVPIADFYHQPILVPIARVMSLIFFFHAFGLVQGCLFTRAMNFSTQAKALILATLLSSALGIGMALRGFGVWSLVAQSVSNAAFRSALLWAFSSWRPLWRFDTAALSTLLPFGSRLLVSSILGTLYENLYPLVIGKFFTQTQVGFYSRAQLTQRYATDALTGVIINVSFPAYASVQHDPDLLRAGYRRSIIYASVVLFPLMLGLAAVAAPLFPLLFTEKWAPSVPLFQVLCLSGMFYHLHALNLNVLKATGRADLYLRLALIKTTIAFTGVLVASRFGMLGIVWGHVVITWIGLIINTLYTNSLIRYPLSQQLRDVWPCLAMSAASATTVFLVGGQITTLPRVAQVGVLGLLHLALYLGLSRLFRVREPFELLRHLRAHFTRTALPADEATREPVSG